VLPFLAFPVPPGGSRCGSYPRWSVSSTSIARSTSRFVNCESKPPGPTISSSAERRRAARRPPHREAAPGALAATCPPREVYQPRARSCVCTCVDRGMDLLSIHAYTVHRTLPKRDRDSVRRKNQLRRSFKMIVGVASRGCCRRV
jgi:hypothetical protein